MSLSEQFPISHIQSFPEKSPEISLQKSNFEIPKSSSFPKASSHHKIQMHMNRPKVPRVLYDTTPATRTVLAGPANPGMIVESLESRRNEEKRDIQTNNKKEEKNNNNNEKNEKNIQNPIPPKEAQPRGIKGNAISARIKVTRRKKKMSDSDSSLSSSSSGEIEHRTFAVHRGGLSRAISHNLDPLSGPVELTACHKDNVDAAFARETAPVKAGRMNKYGMKRYERPMEKEKSREMWEGKVETVDMRGIQREIRGNVQVDEGQRNEDSQLDDEYVEMKRDREVVAVVKLGGAQIAEDKEKERVKSAGPALKLARPNTPQRVAVNHPDLNRGPQRAEAGPLSSLMSAADSNSLNPHALTNRLLSAGSLTSRRPIKVSNPENNGQHIPQAHSNSAAGGGGIGGHGHGAYQAGGGAGPLTIKDYSRLASACRRSGRIYHESLAYYNMAVLYDNQEQYHSAVKYYKKYAEISHQLGNTWGEALAYNNIGCDYQYLGDEYLPLAIDFHMLHMEITSVPGKFIARTNLGLCYAALANRTKSTDALRMAQEHFQAALRYAVRMSNKVGEAMVISNIAGTERLFNVVADDPLAHLDQSRTASIRQLEVAKEVGDVQAEADARRALGEIASRSGRYRDAVGHLEKVTLPSAHSKSLNNCQIGIAEGNRRINNYMNRLNSAAQQHQQHHHQHSSSSTGNGGEHNPSSHHHHGRDFHPHQYPPKGERSDGGFPPATLLFSPR